MGYGLIPLIAGTVAILAFMSANAQVAQDPQPTQVQTVPAQCPPGVTGPCWQLQYSQGGVVRPSGGGGEPMAHTPINPSAKVMSCTQDSDCLGASRCNGGYCSRFSMACNSDSACKYSEFCDTTRPFHVPEFAGTCAPRGGHYPN